MGGINRYMLYILLVVFCIKNKYMGLDISYYSNIKIDEDGSIKVKPFYELINFSDCEGIIGPEVSTKLYNDFVKFEVVAKNEEEYFYRKYKDWMKAFKVASNKGVVSFH
jgi:hypothetical protein